MPHQANGPELYNAVALALDTGYRHLDTAQVYANEEQIGRAIAARCIGDSPAIRRADIFVTDKLWNTHHRPDMVREACLQSLQRLGLDYIDMYLMHWPIAFRDDPLTLWPRDEHQELIAGQTDFVQTWSAMQSLVAEGLVHGIGVSNFNISQLDRLLLSTNHVPACIQMECHPYLTQHELSQYCASRRIQVVAFSPLGTPNRPNSLTGEPQLFANACVLDVAKRLGRTPAQVLIRYQLERGHCTIPKSMTPKRIVSNADVFGFELTADDVCQLDGLNYGRRFVSFLGCVDFVEYPFKM